MAVSFSWEPTASNRGPALSLSHNMGATATADMDALVSPTSFEQMDGNSSSNGQHFAAELAYGFPGYNNQLTLIPTLALALSTTTNHQQLQPPLVTGTLCRTKPDPSLATLPTR